MTRYAAVRTLPDGRVKKGFPRPTREAAAMSAGHILYDNCGVSKEEAQEFSVSLRETPLGETVRHAPTGYSFRIEETEEA